MFKQNSEMRWWIPRSMVINLYVYLKPPLGYIIYWIIADLWSITVSPVDGDIATTSTTPMNK
jgi:membrane protein insertase Oxa1/YidC/SpoIIIJ